MCPRRLNNGIRFPGTGVISDYESLCGYYVCEYVTLSGYVHVHAGVPRKQNSQCPLGPELQVDMSFRVRILGTDFFFTLPEQYELLATEPSFQLYSLKIDQL